MTPCTPCTCGSTRLEPHTELLITVGSGEKTLIPMIRCAQCGRTTTEQNWNGVPVESLGREASLTVSPTFRGRLMFSDEYITAIIEAIKARSVFVNTPPHGGRPEPWEVP